MVNCIELKTKTMIAISIKIKQSKLSDIDKLTKSLDKYFNRKLKGIPDTTKHSIHFGYLGTDFVDGFIHMVIT